MRSAMLAFASATIALAVVPNMARGYGGADCDQRYSCGVYDGAAGRPDRAAKTARHHHRQAVRKTSTSVDANGNTAAGVVVSRKTGASARVGVAFAARFQAYIDDLESRGAEVRFMGGIRRGHCGPASLHPCGKALDVCQTGRGRVDPRCHLPARHELGRIAAAHGLFEGGAWCRSDYGHAQIGTTAAACGERSFARATTQELSLRTAYKH